MTTGNTQLIERIEQLALQMVNSKHYLDIEAVVGDNKYSNDERQAAKQALRILALRHTTIAELAAIAASLITQGGTCVGPDQAIEDAIALVVRSAN